MVAVFQTLLTAAEVKEKAKELGADLVGIADGRVMDANPPYPNDPKRPSDISDYDNDRVIVLAKRINLGTTRITNWSDRHKFYNDELAITALEETALSLVLWLETQGYPALIIPPTHTDPWKYDGNPSKPMSPLLSAEHAAVEAGMGTLGLNLQLLTPEYGPRVMLIAVMSSVAVKSDKKKESALCHGPECGRCLSTCPSDAVGHWDRDRVACNKSRQPFGFNQLANFLGDVIDAGSPDAQKAMVRSEPSFNLWQSVLRGAGAVVGCRRCQDVCPVGEDYETLLKDALDEIPEDTPEKQARLSEMKDAASEPDTYSQQSRWIGTLE